MFRQGIDKGEHSVITRDLNVGPMSVLQFDVSITCMDDYTLIMPSFEEAAVFLLLYDGW